ncbi:hypothetical protein [Caproicibacter sp.]|uniref:hypothetical protein n=1 Tax=Caproicibacter sp. TaxID=2814884 RepID=UPI003989C5B9
MKKSTFSIFIVLCFCILLFLGWHCISTVQILNQSDLHDYITQKTESKEGQIRVDAVDRKNNFLAALYDKGNEAKLIILERDLIFPDRYRYFGEGSGGSEIETYNYQEGTRDGQQSLIIVYGDNTKLGAASYQFTNSGRMYSKQNLGRYVLDIYWIKHATDQSDKGFVYNKNGNKICAINE